MSEEELPDTTVFGTCTDLPGAVKSKERLRLEITESSRDRMLKISVSGLEEIHWRTGRILATATVTLKEPSHSISHSVLWQVGYDIGRLRTCWVKTARQISKVEYKRLGSKFNPSRSACQFIGEISFSGASKSDPWSTLWSAFFVSNVQHHLPLGCFKAEVPVTTL
ncbi:hypothetical protein CPB84DRAFT_1745725 [Gymnopilus junonius]|uniref:Uncharacterized protein n=1 Tax=Gymnopilus junonius TaxID=109634 RepID=A0A9P5NS01_GYMJU|nr:hypothetical protein CPB84DRAFT_1745725 [Gymnopilus junonius]